MKAKDIIKLMNEWAKPSLIDTWDNTGFQVGNEEKKVDKILISLDLDSFVLEKAIKEGYDMIITHHPLIFKGLKSITTDNYKENLVYKLIKNDIVAYNAHTNLDQVENGVSYELAKVLGLKDIEVLHYTDLEKKYGYGSIGNVDEIKIIDYIEVIKTNLKLNHLIAYGDLKRNIKKIAVCGGAGSDFIADAYTKGADLYITGDVKYHEAQFAVENNLTIVDAGHFHTEKIILPVIKQYLEKNLSDVILDIWNKPSPTYRVF